MDLIILALIAVYIGFRVYKALGNTKYDQDLSDENRKAFEDFKNSLVKEIEATAEKAEHIVMNNEFESQLSENSKAFFEQYRKVDPSFGAEKFVHGAASAFEIILKAYSDADFNTLKNLVAPAMLDKFQKDFDHLKAGAQKRNITLVSVKGVEILNAYQESHHGYIQVKIESEQIIYISDIISGEMITGSMTQVKNCADVWLFSKEMSMKSKMWKLVESN